MIETEKQGRTTAMKKLLLSASLAAALALGGASGALAWNEGGGEQDEATKILFDLMKKVPNDPKLKEKVRKDGIAVFEVCSACHTTEGWGTKDGTFPQLAGQHDTVIIKQLADIRAGNRDNPTMYPFALPKEIKNAAPEVGGGPYAIAVVAMYISQLPMNPDWGKPKEGEVDFEKGKKLFEENCVKCHGKNGEGSREKFFPKIQGQHYLYMLRQFEWIRDGKRRNANPDMVKQIKNFTDEDMKNVVGYVAGRLSPPKERLAPSKDWLNPDYE
jgi:cytochrome c553